MSYPPHLIFALHGSRYALESHLIREVVWLPEVTSIANLPDHFPGVMNYHGRIVPVMDLDKRFGDTSRKYRLSDHVIIFEWDGVTIGLIVNEVLGIQDFDLQENEIVPSLEVGVDPSTRFVDKVVKLQDGIVGILNLSTLLGDHDAVSDLIDDTSAQIPSPDQETEAERSPDANGELLFFQEATPGERALLRERAASIMRMSEEIGRLRISPSRSLSLEF